MNEHTAKSGEKQTTSVTPPTQTTSIHEMMAHAGGQLVKLPPFNEGVPCVVKLKRVSLMALMKHGKIPNQLLNSATSLFNTGKIADESATNKEDYLKQTSQMLDVFARASLVEPTYEQLEQAGVELTDLQLAAIFSYSQSGVKDLERFPNV